MKIGKIIWITGLPASGKTTIAKKVFEKIKKKHLNTVHLDGDNMRSVWGIWAEKSPEGRKKMAMSYAKQCNLLANQGINVIMSTVSLFHEVHDYNRKNNPHYYEVFIQTEDNFLDKRHGEYTSDRPEKQRWKEPSHEFPKTPHLTIDNNTPDQIDLNVNKILQLTNFK